MIFGVILLNNALVGCNLKTANTMEENKLERIKNKEKNNTAITEIIEKAYAIYFEKYESTPFYQLQTSKSGCHLMIETDNEVHRLLDDFASSVGLHFNPFIVKSGKQELRIKVYPKKGDSLLSPTAYVDLSLDYKHDRQNNNEQPKNIFSFSLSDVISDGELAKLPYFEVKIPIYLDVPFDYEKKYLEDAKDLREITNIRELVINKCLEVRKIGIDKDFVSYLKFRCDAMARYFDRMYLTKDKFLSKFDDIEELSMTYDETSVISKEFFDIEKMELVFLNNGRLAYLLDKKTLHSALDVLIKQKDEETGEVEEDRYENFYMFYMPKNTNELIAW